MCEMVKCQNGEVRKRYYVRVRKSISCLGLIAFLFFFTVTQTGYAAHGKTRIITDMNGRKIEVPDPLTRVALFGGPTGQIAYVLGARDQLCAVTSSLKGSELVRALDPTIVNLPGPRSTSGQVNVEELLLSDPQLVIAGNLDGSIVEKKTKIPVAYTESTMAQGVIRKEIRFYAHIFQREVRGEKYIAYLDKTEAFLRSHTKGIPPEKRKKVFNGYGPAHLVTLGGNTFMHERIVTAGCIDAAASINTAGVKEGLHSGLSEVSMERALDWDPDILIIDSGKPEDVYNDQKWQTVKAVRNRKVLKQPIGIFIWDRPTAEAAVLYPLWLAKNAYPELFKDVDMLKEVKRFYREIMAFNLTDDQAHAVLSGAYTLRFGSAPGKR
jgi:iron complex transport system substrate-binding protein